MNLNEAKQILNSAGYICEDTDDWDEAGTSAKCSPELKEIRSHLGENLDDEAAESITVNSDGALLMAPQYDGDFYTIITLDGNKGRIIVSEDGETAEQSFSFTYSDGDFDSFDNAWGKMTEEFY